jgi:predicted DNA-binding transcriptional regulator AlpA
MEEVLNEEAAAGSLKRGVKPGSKRTKRPARPLPAALSDDEVMLTMTETCTFFGGPGRPIHPATLYRGVADSRYPRPVWIGPNSVRWLLSECREARQRMIDARDKAA